MLKVRQFKTLAIVVTFILLTTLLFGCAPAATEEAPPVETEVVEEAEPVETEEVEEPKPTDTEVVEEPTAIPESSITILIPQDPTGFNGHITDTGYEQMVGELVLLSLSEIDPAGNEFPELAVEIPTIENGGVAFDEDTWTMDVTWKIRDDVYWADGEQVTVDDIIFTWNAVTDPEMGVWTDGVDYTESIERVDDFTFIVHYYEGWVYTSYKVQFGAENFFIYPEHYCDASQGYLAWDCNQEILSSGPYVLEEWVTSDHMTFVRNENYFDSSKPAIDKVIVKIVPEQSVRRTMMLEGGGDVHIWPSDAIYEEYIDASNVEGMEAPSDRWVMRLIPNHAAYGSTDPVENPHPFLSDVRVRKAIRMAVDVDTLVEEIFLDHGGPVWTEMFRPPYDVCDIPRPGYDLEGAGALLEEAGWTDSDGDGVRECHGCPNAEEGDTLTMEFAIYAEYGEELELAQQLIAESLESIGFDVELLMLEGAIMWAPYDDGGTEQTGNYDLNMWDDGYPGTDPTDNQMWFFYHTDAGEPDMGWNVMRWSNEDFDAWYDELFYLDEEYRSEVFCEMANILEEELPQILLWSTFEGHGVASRINGAQPSVNDTLTWNVADWTITE